MKKLKEVNFKDQKVLIRCDFNVPIEEGIIEEDERIVSALETINFILDQDPAWVLLISHLGKPKGQIKESLSLQPIKKRLEELLDKKVELVRSLEALIALKEKKEKGELQKLYLLENVRFWPEEEAGDRDWSEKICSGMDIFVNEAFSVSHREHSSVFIFPQLIKEKCPGFLFEKEKKVLTGLLRPEKRPAVAIIGGSKIETKLPTIQFLRENYDAVLVGGKVANEALDKKMDLGEKVFWPVDFSPLDEQTSRLDIGEKTVALFREKISSAKTLIWNGPLGMFEREEYSLGTQAIISALEENRLAYKVVGGGETIEALKKFASLADFDYISMSGGAMLEFLSGKELPGIKALEEKNLV